MSKVRIAGAPPDVKGSSASTFTTKELTPDRASQLIQNQAEKRALVEGGRAHGILVYDADEPIGRCQFGPAGYATLTPENPNWTHVGTVPLLERAGFVVVDRPSKKYVVMQREV